MQTTSRAGAATMDVEEFATQSASIVAAITRTIAFTTPAIVATTVGAASGTRKTTIGWGSAAMITMTTASAQGAAAARITKQQ